MCVQREKNMECSGTLCIIFTLLFYQIFIFYLMLILQGYNRRGE